MCVKCNQDGLHKKLSRIPREAYWGPGSEFPAENSPFIMRGCQRWETEMKERIVYRHLNDNGSIHGLREVFIAMHMWEGLDIIDRYLAFGEPGSWVPVEQLNQKERQLKEVCV